MELIEKRLKKWHLSNRRVTVCPLELRHSAGLQLLMQYDGLFKYMTLDFGTPQKTEAYIKTAEREWEQGHTLAFAIENPDGLLVGTTCIRMISAQNRRGEIGWTALRPEYQGTGYNKQVKWLLLNLCFNYLHFVRVELKTDLLNLRSQRAIEKLGATHEGIFRKHLLMPSGRWRDSVWYSILDTDRPTIRNEVFGDLACEEFEIREF